jgi:peptidoglycan hydrolase-like protein with peptidoglycan-binding domain
MEGLGDLHLWMLYEQESSEISPNLRRRALASLLTGFSILVNAEAVQAARALEFGDTGADVVALQDRLKQTGDFPYGTRSTGYLGSITEAAVVQFQKRRGLTPDGVVGVQTQNALNTPTLKLGSQGDYVYQLQAHLLEQGYPLEPDNVLAVDGVFGQQTQTAVLQFQAKQGLEQDGIVGPETHMTLLQPRIIQTSAPSDSSTINRFFSCRGYAGPGAETDQRIAEAITQLDQSDPKRLVSALGLLCRNGGKSFSAKGGGALGASHELIKPAIKASIPRIVTLLNNSDASVRKFASLTLGSMHSRLPAALATGKVIELLNDPDLEVRQAAIDTLNLLDTGYTDKKAPIVRDAFNRQLQGTDPVLRAQVEEEELYRQTPIPQSPLISAQEAQAEVDRRVSKLIAQLNDPDLNVQKQAISILKRSGSVAHAAVPALVQRLTDSTTNSELQVEIIDALGRLGIEEVGVFRI